ncbi:PTS transporter subunit EIIC [Levilactobacillus tangyuanensis]|uniref:Permease IIC component n=1 Tax=Levilactobacillus tangyuanensis TaxID=2486021 RepID=A0ABW1TKL9_9LACO|nr:PTS transporter subunit EIIC [Levilactobacillus tangyuanensis]
MLEMKVGRCGQWLINLDVKLHHNRQFNAVYRALRLTLPLVLIGSIADFIDQAWLQTSGYYYQTLNVSHWLFQLKLLRQYLRLISAGTLGFTAIIMAFAVSFYLVAPITRATADRLLAGMTAVVGLKFLNVSRASVLSLHTVHWVSTNLGTQGILIGILVGLLVGNGYRWALQREQIVRESLSQTVTITSVWLVLLATGGLLWTSTQKASLSSAFLTLVHWPFHLSHFVLGLFGYSSLSGLLQWIGVLGPLATIKGETVQTAQNLAAVMDHPGSVIPHPLTVHTVIGVYANMGGSGMLLALLLAWFLCRPNRAQRRLGSLCLLPTLGNYGVPLMVGLPVMLSPILGIPFILAPLASISLSWLCIRLQWVPAAAYPLATGTPGPLIGYLGTGGHWSALWLALIDLALCTLIYWPFVKWTQLAQRQLMEEAVDHAATHA